MTLKTMDFKCAIVTGGAGGIGKELSKYLLSQGKKVILAGRTESNLQKTTEEIGATAYYVLDTGDIDSIPSFVSKVTKDHPDVDCIINNAGVQRPLDFNEMTTSDFLEKADAEININIRGPMHLILHLLPHLKSKKTATIINVSSVLGFLPFSVINPVYNGTKAWVHMFTLNLRTQLGKGKGSGHIKVVEIAPPSVGTDLHRERENPDDNKKEQNSSALTLEEFMEEVTEGLQSDKDIVTAGMGNDLVSTWNKDFGSKYDEQTKG